MARKIVGYVKVSGKKTPIHDKDFLFYRCGCVTKVLADMPIFGMAFLSKKIGDNCYPKETPNKASPEHAKREIIKVSDKMDEQTNVRLPINPQTPFEKVR